MSLLFQSWDGRRRWLMMGRLNGTSRIRLLLLMLLLLRLLLLLLLLLILVTRSHLRLYHLIGLRPLHQPLAGLHTMPLQRSSLLLLLLLLLLMLLMRFIQLQPL